MYSQPDILLQRPRVAVYHQNYSLVTTKILQMYMYYCNSINLAQCSHNLIPYHLFFFPLQGEKTRRGKCEMHNHVFVGLPGEDTYNRQNVSAPVHT